MTRSGNRDQASVIRKTLSEHQHRLCPNPDHNQAARIKTRSPAKRPLLHTCPNPGAVKLPSTRTPPCRRGSSGSPSLPQPAKQAWDKPDDRTHSLFTMSKNRQAPKPCRSAKTPAGPRNAIPPKPANSCLSADEPVIRDRFSVIRTKPKLAPF